MPPISAAQIQDPVALVLGKFPDDSFEPWKRFSENAAVVFIDRFPGIACGIHTVTQDFVLMEREPNSGRRLSKCSAQAAELVGLLLCQSF